MPLSPSVPGPGFGSGPKSVTAVVHHSLVVLPETPMQGRFADSRVGYFHRCVHDFAREELGPWSREFITRLRLEKKDPTAAVSEVVKPIILSVEGNPEKWRPELKQALKISAGYL